MLSRLPARHDLAAHVLPAAMNINNGQSMIVHEDKYSAIRRVFNQGAEISPSATSTPEAPEHGLSPNRDRVGPRPRRWEYPSRAR